LRRGRGRRQMSWGAEELGPDHSARQSRLLSDYLRGRRRRAAAVIHPHKTPRSFPIAFPRLVNEAMAFRAGRAAPSQRPSPSLLSGAVPSYNAAPLLGRTVRRTVEYLRSLGLRFEVVIADGRQHRRDGAVLEEPAPDICRGTRPATATQSKARAAAVRFPFAVAHGRRVIFMDADGTTSLEAIPVFLARLEDQRRGDRLRGPTRFFVSPCPSRPTAGRWASSCVTWSGE